MGKTERRNVFIVGAGASTEFGLPTGKQLLTRMANLARRSYNRSSETARYAIDGEVRTAILELASELNGYRGVRNEQIDGMLSEAVWICSNLALAPSIDNLLHTHRANPTIGQVGKILIARALIEAERGSSLYLEDEENDISKLFSEKRATYLATESWLGELFWLLVENRELQDFLTALQNITFISFNYDRCIEQFILHAAMSYFRLDQRLVTDVAQRINIIRPYGGLGALSHSGGKFHGFGRYEGSLLATSKGIRTFTEGVADPSSTEKIRNCLDEADLIFFMGFGFIDLNMKLLFDGNPFNAKRAVGTKKGLSDESASIICDILKQKLFFGKDRAELRTAKLSLAAERLELSDMTCKELLGKHQFFLRGNR